MSSGKYYFEIELPAKNENFYFPKINSSPRWFEIFGVMTLFDAYYENEEMNCKNTEGEIENE